MRTIQLLLTMFACICILFVLNKQDNLNSKLDNNILLPINRDTLINILYPTTGSAKRDYQIECNDDSMIVYDGNKKLGTIDYADDSRLSNMVLKDNQ